MKVKSTTRKRSILYSLFFILTILASPSPISAALFINELLPDLPSGEDEDQGEWVEIYNSGPESVDITNYRLIDLKSNTLTIDSTNTSGSLNISPNSYVVITRNGSKFSLNNDQDTVNLFSSTPSATLIDTLTYDHTKTGFSVGRIGDGAQNIVTELVPTKGSPNTPPTPKPTPEPTPTKTPATPKPAVTPQAKASSTPTVVSPTPQDTPTLQDSADTLSPKPEVKGVITSKLTDTPEASVSSQIPTNTNDKNTQPTSAPFIVSGIAFVFAAIVKLFINIKSSTN